MSDTKFSESEVGSPFGAWGTGCRTLCGLPHGDGSLLTPLGDVGKAVLERRNRASDESPSLTQRLVPRGPRSLQAFVPPNPLQLDGRRILQAANIFLSSRAISFATGLEVTCPGNSRCVYALHFVHSGALKESSMSPNLREHLTICDTPTKEESTLLSLRLEEYNQHETNGRIHFPGTQEPGLSFDLAVRGPDGSVVGGINVSSVLGVMWLEVLWTSEAYRGRGIASWLILEAERIAHEAGCVGAGTWTFNWQGASFYPRIGYDLNGVYDGYPRGMTEHVLSKRLPSPSDIQETVALRAAQNRKSGLELISRPTRDEMQIVHRGLHSHCIAHIEAGEDYRGAQVRLILRDGRGELAGGLSASTPVRVLALEEIWIAEQFRGQGYGRRLIEAVEHVARSRGCIAVQGSCLSFQTPGFFHAIGYEPFGRVDVYPDDVWEDLLIRRL